MTVDMSAVHDQIVNVENKELNDGEQVLITFKNGWQASVVRGPYTYGGPEGMWELGVFSPTGGLNYENPATPDDVVGWLSDDAVTAKLAAVASFTDETIHEYRVERKRKELQDILESFAGRLREYNAFDERVISELSFDLRMASRQILRYFGEEEDTDA